MAKKDFLNSIGSIIFITILSQVLAFVRESIFAFYYGAGIESDAYVMASQIPITLFAVVSTAINTVVLPIYISKKNNKGKEAANTFMNSFICIFVILTIVVILIEELFARPIVKVFAPSFSSEQFELTIKYSRILFPTTIFTGIINIITASYNSDGKYLYPTLCALSQSIVLIFSMFLMSNGMGGYAAVYGTVGGIVLNFILIVINKISIFKSKIHLSEMMSDIKLVMSRVVPIALGIGVAEVNRIIDRALASGLETGSITALNYSVKLMTVFSSLILSAVTTVSFKEFSDEYVKNNLKKRNSLLNNYLTLIIFFLIPITIGVAFLKKEVIIIAFARGAFGEKAIEQTVNVFVYYIIGIVFVAVREILSKFFYSEGDTKTPLTNSAISVIINIIMNIILSKFMGAPGLALATSISSIAVCILLFFSAKKKEEYFNLKEVKKDSFFIIISSGCMAAAIFIIKQFVELNNVYAEFAVCVLAGIAVYLITIYIINKKMLKNMISLLISSRK